MLRSIGKQSRGILWRRQRRKKRDASTNQWNELASVENASNRRRRGLLRERCR